MIKGITTQKVNKFCYKLSNFKDDNLNSTNVINRRIHRQIVKFVAELKQRKDVHKIFNYQHR